MTSTLSAITGEEAATWGRRYLARRTAALSAMTLALRRISPEESGADLANNPYLGFLDLFRVTYENELAAFASLASGGTVGVSTVRDALAAMLMTAACDASRLGVTETSRNSQFDEGRSDSPPGLDR